MLGVFAEDFRLLHAILQRQFGFALTLNQLPKFHAGSVLFKNISCMHG